MAKPITLCADDYALAPGVSEAILELLAAGRITTTSCMVTTPFWAEGAVALRERQAEIGLHLVVDGLTLRQRLYDVGAAKSLILRQLDRFTDALGREPDFIDGHRHQHLLPAIAQALVEVVVGRPRQKPPWVRTTVEPARWIGRRGIAPAKALLLSVASRPLVARLQRAGIISNDSFRGVASLTGSSDVRAEFRRFLDGAGERPLVICHPGRADAALRAADPVVERREQELSYLGGPAFLADLIAADLVVGPLAPETSP